MHACRNTLVIISVHNVFQNRASQYLALIECKEVENGKHILPEAVILELYTV